MNKTQDSLEFFKPVAVEGKVYARIPENQVKVRAKSGVIAFSSEFGKSLSGYKNVTFMENSFTGECAFVFRKDNNADGFPIHRKSDDCSYYVVSSKPLVSSLIKKLGLSNESSTIFLGDNISKNPNVIFRMISVQ